MAVPPVASGVSLFPYPVSLPELDSGDNPFPGSLVAGIAKGEGTRPSTFLPRNGSAAERRGMGLLEKSRG